MANIEGELKFFFFLLCHGKITGRAVFRCKASRSNLVRRTLFPHVVKKGPWGRKRFAKMLWHKVKNEVNERYTSSRNVTVALRMRTTVLPGQGKHGHLFRPYIMSYLHGIADNFWFSLMWWDGHVGVQNNGKMSLKFCIIVESNSQKTFFAIVLSTKMAAVTSRENRELLLVDYCIICRWKASQVLIEIQCTLSANQKRDSDFNV